MPQPELDVKALTITFGNTLATAAYDNTLKIFASLVREFDHDPSARERYCNVRTEDKIVLARGAEGPVDGERDVAAYFVSACFQIRAWIVLPGRSPALMDFSTARTGCPTFPRPIHTLPRPRFPPKERYTSTCTSKRINRLIRSSSTF